jgi:hypothetical protein
MNTQLYETIENEYKGKNAHRFSQSFFVPHVDGSIGLDQLAVLIEQTYEMGVIDRMEYVPKTNQTDGHAYYQAFVYMQTWGNGYFAQHVRNQLMRGIQTPMYYTDFAGKQRFVKCCANRSELAWLPHPEHTDLTLTVAAGTIDTEALMEAIELDYEFGKVRSVEVSAPRLSTEDGDRMVVDMTIHMEYWYHTESAYVFQEMMRRNWYVKMEYLDLNMPKEETKEEPLQEEIVSMIFFARTPTTEGINPFVYWPHAPMQGQTYVQGPMQGQTQEKEYTQVVDPKYPPNLGWAMQSDSVVYA